MVCSQAYSQASSHCGRWKTQQHNDVSPRFLNVSEFDEGPENSEACYLKNTVLDGKLWSSRGFRSYSSSGNPNALSPLKSSWIQRLIPSSHATGLQQPQDTDNHMSESHGINGMWTTETPLYENSRGSKHDLHSSHQTLLGTATLHGGEGAANAGTSSSPFEASEAPKPEMQVSPKLMPIVESLLPGYSKKVNERQTSTETSKFQTLSKRTAFSNDVKQTVLFSADKRPRVSCSSIEGLKSQSAALAAGSFPSFKSLGADKTCFKQSQPMPESYLKGAEALTMSTMSPIYGGKDCHLSPNLNRGYMGLPDTRPAVNLQTERRWPFWYADGPSAVERPEFAENSLLCEPAMPNGGEGIELFSNSHTQAKFFSSNTDERMHSDVCMDQSLHLKRSTRNTDCWHPEEYHDYGGDTSFRSKALIERRSAVDREGLGQSMTKHAFHRGSDNFSVHYGVKRAKEKAGPFSSHQMLEQALGSSHGYHQERPGTSASFSFHFGKLLSYKPEHAEGVEVEWPFSLATEPIGNSVQSKWPSGEGNAELVEASRPGNMHNNSATLEKKNGRVASTSFISRRPSSPSFGIESSTELARHRLSLKDNVSPYKAVCNDIRGACFGKANTEPVHGNSVEQFGEIEQQERVKSVRGVHLLSRAESELNIECMEDKELRYPHFLGRTSNRNNWMGFKPSTTSSVHAPRLSGSFPPAGADLKKTGGTSKLYLGGHNTNIGSCSKMHGTILVCDPSSTNDEEGRIPGGHPSFKKPGALPSSALGKQAWDTGKQIAGSVLNVAPNGMESEAGVAVGRKGPVVKRKMWLQRWCAASSIRKVQGNFFNLSRGVGMSHHLTSLKGDCGTVRGRRGVTDFTSESVDLRPAKRVCHEKRCGLQVEPGKAVSGFDSVPLWRQRHVGGVASQFMKRFFTPSAAAMVIMGMTARQVHATQPQKKGLFSAWASSTAPTVRFPIAHTEAFKDSKTISNSTKEFPQVASEHPPTPVNT